MSSTVSALRSYFDPEGFGVGSGKRCVSPEPSLPVSMSTLPRNFAPSFTPDARGVEIAAHVR